MIEIIAGVWKWNEKTRMFCGFSPEMNVIQLLPDHCVSSLYALFRFEPAIAVSCTYSSMKYNVGTHQPCTVLLHEYTVMYCI